MAKKRSGKQRNVENAAKNANRNIAEKNVKSTKNIAQLEVRHDKNNTAILKDPIACPPKGLSNLGNTCFFNSVMQNLCRTSGLLFVLENAAKLNEITIKDDNIAPFTCQLPPIFKLSQSFLNFLITMGDSTYAHYGSHKVRTRVESPKALFTQICSVSPRFRTYQQQDSLELLQSLLDGIKTEEIKRRKQAILSKLGLLGKKAKDVDDDLKEQVKIYGRIASKLPTAVDIMFGGETVSSVLCDECGRISQVLEHFLDIPLPIAETIPVHHHHNKPSKKSSGNGKPLAEAENKSSECDEEVSDGKSKSMSKHAQKKQRKEGRKGKRNRKKSLNQPSTSKGDIEEVKITDDKSLMTEDKSMVLETARDAQEEEENIAVCQQIHGNAQGQHDEQAFGKMDDTSDKNEVAELCEEVKAMSISNPCNDEYEAIAEVIASKIISNALDIVTGNMEAKKDMADSVDCVQLLGGKSHSGSNASLDKDTNDLTAGVDSIDGNQKIESASSPSSGNDEKSEVENRKIPSLFETPLKKTEVTFTGFCKKLPSSLSPRYDPGKNECSISTCLHKFTMAEMLTGNNKFGCEECTKRSNKGVEKPKTVYCNASKQMLIRRPPLILTLQLKRFQQSGFNLRKLSKRVEITENLDLSPFCSTESRDYADDKGEIMYRLCGIVEHSGSMSRGHYTAYVCVRPESMSIMRHLGKKHLNTSDEEEVPGQWYHISDTSVTKCTLSRALNCNAYLIFYERTF